MKFTPQLASMGPLTQATFNRYICNRHRTARLGAAANAIFANNFCPMRKLSIKLTPLLASMGALTQATFHRYICNRYPAAYRKRKSWRVVAANAFFAITLP